MIAAENGVEVPLASGSTDSWLTGSETTLVPVADVAVKKYTFCEPIHGLPSEMLSSRALKLPLEPPSAEASPLTNPRSQPFAGGNGPVKVRVEGSRVGLGAEKFNA